MIKGLLNKIPEKIMILLFWPVFGTIFSCMEKVDPERCHTVYCFLDDKIPFCEYFIIPYYFWFVFLFGMIVYGFLWDYAAFKNYMKFTMITYIVTIIIYLVYPTAQSLRPDAFENNSIFTQIVKRAYSVDTNTNVCPSIHVLGSMAVYFAARKSKAFGSLPWRIAFFVTAVLITLSTLFVKQHSVIDIVAAIILGLIVYPFVYSAKKGNFKLKTEQKTAAGVGV